MSFHSSRWTRGAVIAGTVLFATPVGAAEGPVESGSAMPGIGLLVGYGICVIASSLLGGWLPSLMRLTHTRLQLLISLIGGLMLGVGLLHQLPHAVTVLADAGVPHALDRSLLGMVAGLTAMFFLLRTFHFHQHETFQNDDAEPHPHDHSHDHDRGHAHDHSLDVIQPAPHTTQRHVHGGSWIGIALGLSLHSLTDGLALAAHVQADLLHTPSAWWPGIGTFLGIVLHKPLDSLSITSLMKAAGWSSGWRNAVNFGYALLCPLGALLVFFGASAMPVWQSVIVGGALAFSAGVFVCIALSDLLPEVEFHSHDRVPLSASLVLGLVLAWAIGFLEPEHSHGGHEHGTAEESGHHHDHDHP
jgi:zinc and cadmium transporter